MTISDAPLPISILFVGLLLLAIWLLAWQTRKAAIAAGYEPPVSRLAFFGVLGFCLAWAAYAAILALSGFLYVHASPPRQVLYTTLPLVVLVILVIPRTAFYKRILAASRVEDLIRLHIFRLIGGVFILLYLVGRLPAPFGLIAGPGDLITALACYPIAHYVFVRKTLSVRWVYAWNIFGLVDILTAITLVVVLNLQAARATPEPVPGSILELAKFPFAMGTAFATATIVFLHISIFRKLRAMAKERAAAETLSPAR
jgi:hypothetical protein